jgi:hypothetical protein
MSTEQTWVGWFYNRGGRRLGPVTRSTIAGLVARGQLRHTDPVWKAWSQCDEFQLEPARADEALDPTVSSAARIRPGFESVN